MRVMAMSGDDRANRSARWRSGVELELSWREYGDERQLALQAKKRGTPQALVYQRLMVANVCSEIFSGELQAMGYRLAPAPSDGPVPIPADLFERVGAEIMESRLHVGAELFDRIRVLPKAEASPALDVRGGTQATDAVALIGQVRSRKAGGRPSRRAEIEAAARRIIARDGPEFFELTSKEATQAVAREITAQTGQTSSKGLTPETVRRVLKSIRADPDASKPQNRF